MDKTGAECFVYAKACGLLAKSFTGSRAAALFDARSLSELWTLLFRTQAPLVPEVMLAGQIERAAFSSFIGDYTCFVEQFDRPDGILTEQLRMYEVEDLKEVGAALCSGEQECPPLIELGKFTTLDFSKWPDIKRITENSPYSWYDSVPGAHEQQKTEFRLDVQTVRAIWNAANCVRGDGSGALVSLYRDEYVMKNIVWALRLRINYQMSDDEILSRLFFVTGTRAAAKDPLAGPAVQLLSRKTDLYDEWRDWKYAEFLNPHEEGSIWSVDPVWIERMSRIRQNRTAGKIFRQYPMTTAALIAWFKMKSFELSCIRTAVESLRLNVPGGEAMEAVGVS